MVAPTVAVVIDIWVFVLIAPPLGEIFGVAAADWLATKNGNALDTAPPGLTTLTVH